MNMLKCSSKFVVMVDGVVADLTENTSASSNTEYAEMETTTALLMTQINFLHHENNFW